LTETTSFFQTHDQLALYFKAIRVDAGKASVVFVHGVGEHIGRYAEAFQAFSEQGYSCFGFDQRGFGRSEGERGHVNAFSDYVQDLAAFIDGIVAQDAAKPVFLLGHSMGSIVALAYALRHQAKIQGLLLFSCPLQLQSLPAKLGGFIALGAAFIMPELKLPNLLDPQALSNNPDNIQVFIADPLAFTQVSVNWLREFKRARAEALKHAGQITRPVLMNHGGADTIAALSGARTLFSALGAHDKTLYVYPGLKHELLNHCPAERAKVLEQTFAWLGRRSDVNALP
jgi:alpha-beta hydrolase superfamily lysophospholipase